jgi:hypothetical protein
LIKTPAIINGPITGPLPASSIPAINLLKVLSALKLK